MPNNIAYTIVHELTTSANNPFFNIRVVYFWRRNRLVILISSYVIFSFVNFSAEPNIVSMLIITIKRHLR